MDLIGICNATTDQYAVVELYEFHVTAPTFYASTDDFIEAVEPDTSPFGLFEIGFILHPEDA